MNERITKGTADMRHRHFTQRSDRPATDPARDRGEFSWGGGPRHRGRRRRGDIRIALLFGLEAGPAHGYELIQRLGERTGGRWKPSPGSVYPTLQMLEEEGLVSAAEQDGKKVYELTDAGREALSERAAAGGPPWMGPEAGGPHGDLRAAVGQLVMAAKQIGMGGDPAQVEAATGILTEARRKLYQLLAES